MHVSLKRYMAALPPVQSSDTPPIVRWADRQTKTPFLAFKKEIRRGKSQKNQRVFGFVGTLAAGLPALTSGLSFMLCVKIGSSKFKKSLQFGLFDEIIAQTGGFFFGCTQCKPWVFQGGDLRLHMC